MATPIKETPVLKSADAIIFSKRMEISSKKAISKEDLEKLKATQQSFQRLYGKK